VFLVYNTCGQMYTVSAMLGLYVIDHSRNEIR